MYILDHLNEKLKRCLNEFMCAVEELKLKP